MRKIVLIFIAILFISCFNSCKGNKKITGQSQGIDTVWNEKVQDTFYGVKLGEPMQNIINALNSNGLLLDLEKSGSIGCYRTRQQQLFEYGGISWKFVFTNKGDEFDGITFMLPLQDKESAINHYNNVIEYMSRKYIFTDNNNTDSNTSQEKFVFGRNGVTCHVFWMEFNDVKQYKFFGVCLSYEYKYQPSGYGEL